VWSPSAWPVTHCMKGCLLTLTIILLRLCLVSWQERPPVPHNMPDEFALLMRACWDPDPALRPSFNQIIQCLELMLDTLSSEAGSDKGEDSDGVPTVSGMLAQHRGVDGVPPEAAMNGVQRPVLVAAPAAAHLASQSSNSTAANSCMLALLPVPIWLWHPLLLNLRFATSRVCRHSQGFVGGGCPCASAALGMQVAAARTLHLTCRGLLQRTRWWAAPLKAVQLRVVHGSLGPQALMPTNICRTCEREPLSMQLSAAVSSDRDFLDG